MMNFVTDALKKYAVFEGRSRRSEYWYFFLFNILLGIVAQVIDISAGLADAETGAGPLRIITGLAFLIPSIAVGVRRMHDVGKSGWYLLIPIYNIVLLATEGDKGPNEYGDDPKGGSDGNDVSRHLVN